MKARGILCSRTWLRTVLVVMAAVQASAVWADPVVPGFDVEEYATLPAGSLSQGLSFDTSTGDLYVGEDAPSSGKPIYRCPAGGGLPIECAAYGCVLVDPDGVQADPSGCLSGSPGSIIVGGIGHITAILPDESCEVLCTEGFDEGGSDMVTDSQCRLLFTDHLAAKLVGRADGPIGSPETYHCPPKTCSFSDVPRAITVDSLDRAVVDFYGKVRVVDVNDCADIMCHDFGTNDGVNLAFGHGGVWGTDLYALNNADGKLYRIPYTPDPLVCGAPVEVGSGFGFVTDLTFGPDNSLYASMLTEERVLRIVPLTPIPAVSEWGFIVMAVLVVTAGTLVFAWRRKAAA